MNWLSEAAEGKPKICQNLSFIIPVFAHLQFILVAVGSGTSSAELLQRVHTKYQKVTQMWKHLGHWIMVFGFVSSIRTFQICCQKWHLLCVFIAMPTVLYLLLDEVCCSTNRQALVCVLMSKNGFLKVFPLWIFLPSLYGLILTFSVIEFLFIIYILLDWPRHFKTSPGHRGKSSLKLRDFKVCLMWYFLHFLLSDLCHHSLRTLKLDLISEMKTHKRSNADFLYGEMGIFY